MALISRNVTVQPCTRERTRTARHGTGRRWRARPTVDGREGPVRSFDRKSNAEKYVTTVEAEALAGVYVNRSDRTTVVEHAPFWAAARPGLRRVPDLPSFMQFAMGGAVLRRL